MKSSDEIEIIEQIITANDDIFFKDESLDIQFKNCQPISTCMIFDYHNDYMSGETDLITDGSDGKKNKRKSTTPKRTANEDKVSGGSDNINAATWLNNEQNHSTMEESLKNNEVNSDKAPAAPSSRTQKTSTKSNYQYLCHNCNVSFSSRADFESHYRNSYQKTPLYTCVQCKKQLQNIRSFRGHIYKHHIATSYQHQCATCSRKFVSPELLEQHQRIHDVVQQKCVDCGIEFSTFDELKQHRREHRTAEKMKNKDLKWKCVDCGKMLMNRSSLFMHEKIHKDRQYSCEHCPQKFVQKNNLLNHVKTHTKDKKFPCTIPHCGKTFVGKSQLLRHHTFHVNIRNFKCETCGKLYKSERDLKVHSLIHSVSRPHACNHCNKTFLSSSKLKQHFNIHTGARPFKCKYCQKDFTNFPNWLKHIRRRHKVDHKTGEQLEEMPNFLIKDRKENKESRANNRREENGKQKKTKKKDQTTKIPKIEQADPVEVLTMSLDDTLPLNTSDDLERAAMMLMQQTLEMEENDARFSCLPQDVSDIPEQNLYHVNDYMTDQIIFSTAITEPSLSSSFSQFFSYSTTPIIGGVGNDDQTKITLPPITTMKNKRNLIDHTTQQLFPTNVLPAGVISLLSDMSCQPRLPEDPYTFTSEFTFAEPPVTTTFFKNSQIQKLPPIKQLNKVQTLNQVKSQGVNGIGSFSNGLHTKNHVPIYARSQQQASQHILLYRKSQPNQAQQVIKKSAPPPPPPPPPLYQQTQRTFIVNQQNHSVTSSPVQQQQQQLQQQQQPPQPQPQQQQQQQQSTKKQQILRTSFVSSFDNFISNQKKASIPNKVKYEKNEPSENVLKSVNGGKSGNTVKATNGTVTGGNKSSSAQIFVRPKVEAKAFVAVKKSTGKSQSVTRVKRSYSQSSHHEALQRISVPKPSTEWHAPDTYVFDYAGPGSLPLSQIELMPFTQNIWHQSLVNAASREQRLEEKRNSLRRQAYQLEQAQKFRHTSDSKKRLVEVVKTLQKPKPYKEPTLTKKCVIPSCTSDSLALTAYCFLHITLNTDQRLFHPCTAKFADNSQCRVPVFDISHELPLCREHAWKRDNYNRMLQEQKPKKPPRKKPKPSAMTRPPKRNKKKRKPPPKQNVISAIDLYNHATVIKANGIVVSKIGHNDIGRNNGPVIQAPNGQEFFTICENSSAYESSEDTGVGGLSESELIGTSDEIPLGDTRLLEEHELTNVLNQLPEELAEEAFNELFTVQHNDPYEPTQEEQEDLERALEEVDEQVKSLEQMTGPTNFLDDFLDDEIAIIDDADICTEVLHSPDHQTDNRGMIHT